MSEMGRCSGGLIGDHPIILYRPAWSVRTQILLQAGFFQEMQDIGAFNHLDKPFVFSKENYDEYHFLRTGSNFPEEVFHYDGNSETVRTTGLSFMDYMKDAIRRYLRYGRNVICRGELLNIV